LLEADICDLNGRPVPQVVSTEPFAVRLRYVLPESAPGARIGIRIQAPDGTPLFTSSPIDAELELPTAAGQYMARAVIPADTLLAGEFQLAACLWDQGSILDFQEPALSFTVYPGPSPPYLQGLDRRGFVQVPCRWTIQAVASNAAAEASR
jgi:hypothetical protein